MTFDKKERRKNQRFFFTLKKGVTINLVKKGNSSEMYPTTLLSLSEGGASVALNRKNLDNIRKGDQFIFRSNIESEPLRSINGAEVQIKYIQDYHIYINVSCGCKFTKISDGKKQKIQKWIDMRLRKENGGNI